MTVYLHISLFTFIDRMIKYWCGVIKDCYGSSQVVYYPMTQSDAIRLSLTDTNGKHRNIYKKGNVSSRFENRKHLISYAIRIAQNLYPEMDEIIITENSKDIGTLRIKT